MILFFFYKISVCIIYIFKRQLKPRERTSLNYCNALKEKFAAHPQVRRIARHRQVPKHIYNAQAEIRTIREKSKRKYVLLENFKMILFIYLLLIECDDILFFWCIIGKLIDVLIQSKEQYHLYRKGKSMLYVRMSKVYDYFVLRFVEYIQIYT